MSPSEATPDLRRFNALYPDRQLGRMHFGRELSLTVDDEDEIDAALRQCGAATVSWGRVPNGGRVLKFGVVESNDQPARTVVDRIVAAFEPQYNAAARLSATIRRGPDHVHNLTHCELKFIDLFATNTLAASIRGLPGIGYVDDLDKPYSETLRFSLKYPTRRLKLIWHIVQSIATNHRILILNEDAPAGKLIHDEHDEGYGCSVWHDSAFDRNLVDHPSQVTELEAAAMAALLRDVGLALSNEQPRYDEVTA